MATIAIYDVHPHEKKALQRALTNHTVKLIAEPLTEKNVVAQADVISGFITSDFSQKTLQKFTKLKAIACRSTGFDKVDIEYCKTNEIAVYNVPFYGENTIAEHTFGLILSLSRKIHESYIRACSLNFTLDGLTGFDLKGKTIGIVGGGHIGMHVARIAKGFGMTVQVYDVQQQHFFSELVGFTYVPLKKLLQTSDIITLHAPYNAHTHHLINKTNIKFVKKGVMFINTARGGLIDTKELVKALKNGTFAMAGLDVIEGEELLTNQNFREKHNSKFEQVLSRNKELCGMKNVLFTPHNAFNSTEALQRILDSSIENILGSLKAVQTNRVC